MYTGFREWMKVPEELRGQISSIYVNMGKAIAAYVRKLMPAPSRFDEYVEAVVEGDAGGVDVLSVEEVEGLRLFIGKANCVSCHNGPLFTNGEFHAVGAPDAGDIDPGRAAVLSAIPDDEFSCLGPHSDADPQEDCAHVRFMDDEASKYQRAFKTPTLRSVAGRPHYMHSGQFTTFSRVLKGYRQAARNGKGADLEHANLTDMELERLEAFMHTLTSKISKAP